MGTRNVNGIAIDTAYIRPPMPLSMPAPAPGPDKDWMAVEANFDLGRPQGFGRTEQDAINDLLKYLEE